MDGQEIFEELASVMPGRVTVITDDSELDDWAKGLGKKVEDLTEEEKKAARDNWRRIVEADYATSSY